jgi:hypothetical protein
LNLVFGISTINHVVSLPAIQSGGVNITQITEVRAYVPALMKIVVRRGYHRLSTEQAISNDVFFSCIIERITYAVAPTGCWE